MQCEWSNWFCAQSSSFRQCCYWRKPWAIPVQPKILCDWGGTWCDVTGTLPWDGFGCVQDAAYWYCSLCNNPGAAEPHVATWVGFLFLSFVLNVLLQLFPIHTSRQLLLFEHRDPRPSGNKTYFFAGSQQPAQAVLICDCPAALLLTRWINEGITGLHLHSCHQEPVTNI